MTLATIGTELSDALLTQLQVKAAAAGISIEQLVADAVEAYDPVVGQSLLALDILDLAADAAVVIDETQTIVRFNKSAEETFQYPAAEAIGQPLSILLPADIAARHHDHIHQFQQSTDVSRHMMQRATVRGKRKDGTYFPIEASITKYQVGEQLYFAAIVRDVSEREAMMAELDERQRLLSVLAENATDVICLHELDGEYLYVSPAAKAVWGYKPEELLGKSPYEFFHPDESDTLLQSHMTSVDGRPRVRLTYRFRHKNGDYIWLETRTNPVLDEHGNPEKLVTVSTDVTAQRDFQESLRQERDLLRNITETSPAGITVVDKNGAITFANRRAEEILGLTRKDMQSRTYDAPQWQHTDYEGNPFPDEQQPFVQVMRTKAPVWNVRQAVVRDDGNIIYLAINGAPVFDEDGEISQVVFTVEDYTTRKYQEDELLKALKREKQLNEVKTNFIAMVSHEFRTPMAVIKSTMDILRLRKDDLTADELERRLAGVDLQIDRLTQLLSDVMFINRDEQVGQSPRADEISLHQFFGQLAEATSIAFPDHRPVNVAGQCENHPFVYMDIPLMQQIFMNLFSNAMKYSPWDGIVTCRYTCDGDKLAVTISDNGIGIPAKDQAQLFDTFHRAKNVGNIPGTGLGMAIIQRAVTALQGSITFTSEEGKGTTFTVTLPLQLDPANETPPTGTG